MSKAVSKVSSGGPEGLLGRQGEQGPLASGLPPVSPQPQTDRNNGLIDTSGLEYPLGGGKCCLVSEQLENCPSGQGSGFRISLTN